MTIDLYISSSVSTTVEQLAKIIKVQCSITPNMSVLKDGTLETGYHIKLIDFDRKEFKTKIWIPLVNHLGIRCAFVREDDHYMGCVLNWPSVFVPTRCATPKIELDSC